ncbi:MAG: hypothetical protein A2087_04880 [Spirochaetes bacterium GWD1_61_31]|nr:MAG: hypothetical protein A2Y37_01580 [Spirochaetes bacterium GWB1_60_80]OHD34906.1 MAG: hypothetical protein A2004_00610 [Spirochaetes bacterium GWC1_61_12]OHD37065.1 MAG: hypothetical protein A2087_04880 [Spirochaetes bacterium GWD1_61_31]OHD61077.1 MAG: hypothetical protein A2Y32_09195 [Spirochaetes bacterium GWF1_60_12]HAP42737.1 hypothetical protein [Spirochaetaceae bacterium]
MTDNKRFLGKIALSLLLTPVITLFLGEAFTHLYNIMLDVPISTRLTFTFQKPMIFALVAVLIVVMEAAILLLLQPLVSYLRRPDRNDETLYAKARKAALGLPWLLIIVTVGFWTLGTVIFYALNDWKSPGGTPLGWVLAFKISEGMLSATLNALIINRILIGAKQALHIEQVRAGEVDIFNKARDIINVLATMAATIAHLAYVARYFVDRNPAWQGPHNAVLALLLVGLVIGGTSFAMVLLARDEDRTQTGLLRKRIMELTATKAADLAARATIINFNAIGDLADSFNRYTDSLRGMIQEIVTSTRSLSDTNQALSGGSNDLKRAVAEIARSAGDIGQLVQDEVRAVGSTSASIEQIGRGIDGLQDSIGEQAAMVTQSSAGIEEMIQNIASVSGNVEQVQNFYVELQQAAGTGRKKINEANGLITRVAQMSGLLADANKVIAAIASQTNLLAMNAAIEAAHAGSAGAGFSVVADEIRSLAEKSSVQSKEVSHHLKEVKNSIDQAVTAAADAEHGFEAVNQLIDTVSRYEDEIRNALREQTVGSKQVLEALTAMNTVSETVKNEAGEMTGGVRIIVTNMQQLQQLSQRMASEMQTIDTDVRNINQTVQHILSMIASNTAAIEQVNGQVQRFAI